MCTRVVVAAWLFIAPRAAAPTDLWLRDRGHVNGLAGNPRLGEEEVAALKLALAGLGLGDGCVVEVQQRAGDMVHVPPGWIHQVVNMRPCLKLAWDFADLTRMHLYIRAANEIGAPLFGDALAADYMGVRPMLGLLLSPD